MDESEHLDGGRTVITYWPANRVEIKTEKFIPDQPLGVALILPLIGLAMRCTRPCARCRALAAEVERLRPEWDRVREEYQRAHSEPKQPPTQEQQGRR
jgi:hypothetical protein